MDEHDKHAMYAFAVRSWLSYGSLEQATATLQAGAKANDGRAMFALGLLSRWILPSQKEAAVAWFQEAALHNQPYAHFNIACMYSEGGGMPVDYEKARYHFTLARKHAYDRSTEEAGRIESFLLGNITNSL